MAEQGSELIEKYGADLLLFTDSRILNGIIWNYPAYSDEEWALILKSVSTAARTRVLDHLPQARRESVSALSKSIPLPSHEQLAVLIADFLRCYSFSSCLFPDKDFDDFEHFDSPPLKPKFLWIEESYSSFTADPEDTIVRWLMITNAWREHGGIVFDSLLEADIDIYTREILMRAMQTPNSKKFEVRDLRESLLGEVRNTLEGMSELFLGICKGDRPDKFIALLADKFNLKQSEVHPGPIMHESIVEGPQNTESVNSMLGLMDKALNDGILSVDIDVPKITSSFFRDGLTHVTDGFEPETLELWAKGRINLILQYVGWSFDIVETGCRCILGSFSPHMTRVALQAHVFEKLPMTRETGLLPQEGNNENKTEYSAIQGDDGSKFFVDQGDDPATLFGWFVFKLSLDEVKSGNPHDFDQLSVVAELASMIPPKRWVGMDYVLSQQQRIDAFHLGLEFIVQSNEEEIGISLLNLVQNLQPDFDALSDNYTQYRGMYQELAGLKYWDALLLERIEFAQLLGRLRAEEIASFASSSWGFFAANVGMPVGEQRGAGCSWQQASSSLLAGLADMIISNYDFKVSACEQRDKKSPAVRLIDTLVKKYADTFVYGSAPVHKSLSEKVVAGLYVMDALERVSVFSRLHENIILHVLLELEPYTDDFDLICSLLPHLNQEKRESLQTVIIDSDCKIAVTLTRVLSFGFDQMIELSDYQIRELLKYVSNVDLCLALADASEELIELFMSNMSERAGDMIREDMEMQGCSLNQEQVFKAKYNLVKVVLEYGLLSSEQDCGQDSNESIVQRIVAVASDFDDDDLFSDPDDIFSEN
ncbi:FliG C-terminal domain-containing protein [Maridesulfovibrio sp.]|uniref:FliG C-terminal domain-containing protein n=1 Tax=Maridesulfovibrio sp. TaxID=2795000 RepID=UPI0029C9F51E|nr:FliG C-terminal domain-containing protein [Maridesulfovibrio sp.]